MEKTKCYYDEYEDYLESSCGNQIDKCDFENICPTFCPFCGEEISVN